MVFGAKELMVIYYADADSYSDFCLVIAFPKPVRRESNLLICYFVSVLQVSGVFLSPASTPPTTVAP
jgi:hypothetical protein